MAKPEVSARRSGRGWKKTMAIGLLIAFSLYILLSLGGSAVAFRVLFGRSEYSPENLEWRYEDVDAARYPRESAVFPSGDNLLRGYLYGGEDAAGVVVMVHGLTGGADSHLPETLWLVDHGWRVFCFDGTGTRESEGDGIVGLAQMKLDLLATLDYIEAVLPETAVVLYGHSMGAYAAAAVLDDRPEVRAAVCVSAFDSPVDTMYYHAKSRVGLLAAIEYPFLRLENYLVFGKEGAETAVEAISAGDTPVLMVYGSGDTVVPESISVYGRRGAVTNPNAVWLFVEDAPRNTHSTGWLSAAGAEYYLEKVAEREALHREYGAPLPEAVLEKFLNGIDRSLLCQLDEEFMNTVLEFYNDAA